MVPFGHGKRICMGESLAKGQLFIFLTAMLQRMEVSPPPQEQGIIQPDPTKFSMGATVIPLPFHIRVKPRGY